MAKSKKRKKTKKSGTIPKRQSHWQLNLPTWQQVGIAVLVIIVATLIIQSNLTFKGMTPAGSDVIGSMGKSHLLKEYEKKTGEESLWNPAIFSGMPQYQRYGPRSFSLDKIAGLFYNSNSGQVVVHYIIGATGMFVCLYSLNFSILISLFGAFAFLLMPHYNSLWLEGHFSKFRAIMYIPWVVAAFNHFITKRTMLASLLFALAFSLQIRTQHYQIIFYTALLLFSLGIYPFIKLLIDKEFRIAGKSVALLIMAAVFTVLSVYQPLFVMKEYTPYSTRGGNPVHIQNVDKSAEKAGGVTFEYATKWSLSPRELVTFVIPNYFGGQSQVKYTGDDVPRLKNKRIPGYWGDMPFTSSTDYIGVALFMLMLLGIHGYRDDWRVRSLTIFAVLGTLLGFGRHFPLFYKIFFYGLPFFSKFRIPTMILMALFFVFVLLAAYGIRYLIARAREDRTALRVIVFITVIMIVLVLSPYVLKSMGALSFSQPQDSRMFNAQLAPLIQNARYDLAKMDAMRTFGFTMLVLLVMLAILRNWLSPSIALLGLIAIMMFDTATVNARFFDKLVQADTLEARLFAKDRVDEALLTRDAQSPEPFRVLGLGNLFGRNDLAYYHQCINGYDAAKMQTIQDLIDNNLYHGPDPQFPLNWNLINMLNGRFLVVDGKLPGEKVSPVVMDQQTKRLLYENPDALGRCTLVGNVEVFQDSRELLQRLNDPEFNPAKTALLESPLLEQIGMPDSLSYANVTSYTPNKIEIEAKSNTQCLLVLSEVYYPEGWKAYVDGHETAIYKTNHILRSIVLPAGESKVKFEFRPPTYIKGKFIATISNLVLLIAIVGLAYVSYRKKEK